MTGPVRVGTRGSGLALWQTETVVAALRQLDPSADFSIVTVRSAGDEDPEAPLSSLGVGVFTAAIGRALAEGKVDLAVHSLKDLPVQAAPGMIVVPVMEREDPRDVLVDRWSKTLLDLPAGARIGSSSPRRTAQLSYGRNDVVFTPMRGNVETRVRKAGGPDYDGAVLAAAGVKRLGLERYVSEYLSPHVCAPAPGQGALAVEVRTDDAALLALVRGLVDPPTEAAVEAERAVLRAVGGGCQVPIGALAEVEGSEVRLFATATPLDGSYSYRVEVAGDAADPEVVGRAAYYALLDQGAGGLLTGAAS